MSRDGPVASERHSMVPSAASDLDGTLGSGPRSMPSLPLPRNTLQLDDPPMPLDVVKVIAESHAQRHASFGSSQSSHTAYAGGSGAPSNSQQHVWRTADSAAQPDPPAEAPAARKRSGVLQYFSHDSQRQRMSKRAERAALGSIAGMQNLLSRRIYITEERGAALNNVARQHGHDAGAQPSGAGPGKPNTAVTWPNTRANLSSAHPELTTAGAAHSEPLASVDPELIMKASTDAEGPRDARSLQRKPTRLTRLRNAAQGNTGSVRLRRSKAAMLLFNLEAHEEVTIRADFEDALKFRTAHVRPDDYVALMQTVSADVSGLSDACDAEAGSSGKGQAPKAPKAKAGPSGSNRRTSSGGGNVAESALEKELKSWTPQVVVVRVTDAMTDFEQASIAVHLMAHRIVVVFASGCNGAAVRKWNEFLHQSWPVLTSMDELLQFASNDLPSLLTLRAAVAEDVHEAIQPLSEVNVWTHEMRRMPMRVVPGGVSLVNLLGLVRLVASALEAAGMAVDSDVRKVTMLISAGTVAVQHLLRGRGDEASKVGGAAAVVSSLWDVMWADGIMAGIEALGVLESSVLGGVTLFSGAMSKACAAVSRPALVRTVAAFIGNLQVLWLLFPSLRRSEERNAAVSGPLYGKATLTRATTDRSAPSKAPPTQGKHRKGVAAAEAPPPPSEDLVDITGWLQAYSSDAEDMSQKEAQRAVRRDRAAYQPQLPTARSRSPGSLRPDMLRQMHGSGAPEPVSEQPAVMQACAANGGHAERGGGKFAADTPSRTASLPSSPEADADADADANRCFYVPDSCRAGHEARDAALAALAALSSTMDKTFEEDGDEEDWDSEPVTRKLLEYSKRKFAGGLDNVGGTPSVGALGRPIAPRDANRAIFKQLSTIMEAYTVELAGASVGMRRVGTGTASLHALGRMGSLSRHSSTTTLSVTHENNPQITTPSEPFTDLSMDVPFSYNGSEMSLGAAKTLPPPAQSEAPSHATRPAWKGLHLPAPSESRYTSSLPSEGSPRQFNPT